ncbi:hypothetical protein [Cutibacterium sp. V947]|uniref:hypothetical protein n=1 Tax=Cutibacterium sp. V947 TaxID=3446480 RepID=UPI004042306E
MADDGFQEGKHPDDSHSDDNETELTPDQPDSDTGPGQGYEPTQELPEDLEFSIEPDGSQSPYADQQYPQPGDSQNDQYPQGWSYYQPDGYAYPQNPNQYPQGWNQYPQVGDGWGAQDAAAGWGPQTGQYADLNGQYPQQGWDPAQYPQQGRQGQQGWGQQGQGQQPGQQDWTLGYPQGEWQTPQNQHGWGEQQEWNANQNPQGWDPHQHQQGWDPNQNPQGWDQQHHWEGAEPAGNWNDANFQDQQQLGDSQQFRPGTGNEWNQQVGVDQNGRAYDYGQVYGLQADYGPDLCAGPAGASANDRPNVSESVGGIPFSDEPQPQRKSQYWIIAVAAVLVVALGVGLFHFLKTNDDATKAVPAPTPKTQTPEVTVTSTLTATASSTASTPATPMPKVANNASVTPTPDLVRQLFNAPDAQVQWVSLAADGQNAAVAYAPSFNINGKSAGPDGGHLVMRKNKDHWEPLPQGGVITDDNDCDAMLKTLGNKAAVATSQVMNNKQCDAAIVYDLAVNSPIRLGKMAGVGPLNLDKATSELAATIHVIPDGVSDGCARNTPVYARYSGFLGGVWTSGGNVQAYLFVGGTNASSNGARIGISEAQLRSDYSKLKLTDVTSDFSGMGYEKALAFSNDGKEVDYLLTGGKVVAYMIRNSDFSPTSC